MEPETEDTDIDTDPPGKPPGRLPRIVAAGRVRRMIWNLAWLFLYRPTPVAAHRWRAFILRMFGAKIAWPVYPYPSTRIWGPWNLGMARGSCLAPGVDCYNVARVELGEGVTVSQKSYLCTASHDFDDPSFALTGAPITLERNVWIAADAFIGPGIHIGADAVVLARAVIVRDIPPGRVVGGNPAQDFRARKTTAMYDTAHHTMEPRPHELAD